MKRLSRDINPAMKYHRLSFPLVGNLSCVLTKRDAGQAGMTDPVVTVLSCRVNKSLTPVLPTDYCGISDATLTKSALIMAVFVLLLLLISLSERAVAGVRDDAGNAARVVRVNDGDTVTVSMNGRREKTRLIGIDAPEIGQGSWGERAKRHLEDMLYSSRNVHIEYDVERRDKYGRLLVYIRTTDGRLVNAGMLRDGYAVLFTFPPNVKHVEEFTSAQRQAREKKRGIWGKDGLSQLPVDWRRHHPRRNY